MDVYSYSSTYQRYTYTYTNWYHIYAQVCTVSYTDIAIVKLAVLDITGSSFSPAIVVLVSAVQIRRRVVSIHVLEF